MADRFGPRGTFAILIPLQNANMQPEYEAMRPAGINNQICRFDISAHDKAAAAILDAVAGSLLCWPEYDHRRHLPGNARLVRGATRGLPGRVCGTGTGHADSVGDRRHRSRVEDN